MISFWFLPSFVSASSVSTPFTRGVSGLSVFLFAGLSVITRGSPGVGFALVLPYSAFLLRVLFLTSSATPARVLDSVFACRLFRLFIGVCRFPIMAVGFAFSFIRLSSLSAFLREFPLPLASVFPTYPSFCFAGLCVVTCGSPFSSPLSARSLLLQGFAAFLAVCLHGSNFSRWFSLLCQLLSSVLSPPSRNSIPLLVCADCFGCFSLAFSDRISLFFYFIFVFIDLASAVSSLALFILAPYVAWLPALLSFSFFLGYAPYFLVLFLFFQRHCLSSSGGFLQRFPGFVRYFPFLFILLVIISSVFFGYVSFFSVLSGVYRAISCVFLGYFGAFPVLLEFCGSS